MVEFTRNGRRTFIEMCGTQGDAEPAKRACDKEALMPDLTDAMCAERAAAARRRAAKATDPDVRAIHERMAADYAELALLLNPRPGASETSALPLRAAET